MKEGVTPPVSQCQLWNSSENKPFEIDRDQNATVNMFRIARGLLFEGKRPDYLTRSSKEETEEELDDVVR